MDSVFDYGFGYAFSMLNNLLSADSVDWMSVQWSYAIPTGPFRHLICELEALRHFAEINMKRDCRVLWLTGSADVIELLAPIVQAGNLSAETIATFPSELCELLTKIKKSVVGKRCTLRPRFVHQKVNFFHGNISNQAAHLELPEVKSKTIASGMAFPCGIFFVPELISDAKDAILGNFNSATSTRAAENDEGEANDLDLNQRTEKKEIEIEGDDEENSDQQSCITLKPTADPSSIVLLQSDASGARSHGFGYIWATFESLLDSDSFFWAAKSWASAARDSEAKFGADAAFTFRTGDTNYLEAWALLDFVYHELPPNCKLLWTNDNLSCVNAINNGVPVARYPLISKILETCKSKNCSIVGCWIPRQLNDTADFLSHLSHSSGQHELTGVTAENDENAFPLGMFFLNSVYSQLPVARVAVQGLLTTQSTHRNVMNSDVDDTSGVINEKVPPSAPEISAVDEATDSTDTNTDSFETYLQLNIGRWENLARSVISIHGKWDTVGSQLNGTAKESYRL